MKGLSALLIYGCGIALAQNAGPDLPAACATGEGFHKTAAPFGIYGCTATNEWVRTTALGPGTDTLGKGLGEVLVVNATVTAHRVVSFVTGTGTITPHVGTTGALGIAGNSGTPGQSVYVTMYGTAICEFVSAPALGNVAGFLGDKCSDLGVTSIALVAQPIGVSGRVIESRADICALCYRVVVLHPAASGTLQAGGSLPSGMITMILSGACPVGFTEAVGLSGFGVIGTTTLAGNVGTTGGSDNITPAGTVAAPTFTGSALGTHSHGVGTLAASSPTFTGSVLGTHLHGVGTYAATAPTFTGSALANHAHELPFYKVTGGTGALRMLAGSIFGTGTSRAAESTAASTANTTAAAVALSQAVTGGTPAGTNSAPTLSGSSAAITAGTPAGTNSAPVVSGSTAAITAGTPSGSNSAPAFTGTQFDNRAAFTRVIFCQAN